MSVSTDTTANDDSRASTEPGQLSNIKHNKIRHEFTVALTGFVAKRGKDGNYVMGTQDGLQGQVQPPRSFPVAAAIFWNTLLVDIQSSPSLPVFRQRLKTFLFHKSFPDVVRQADYAFVDLVMAYCYFSHVKNFLIA